MVPVQNSPQTVISAATSSMPLGTNSITLTGTSGNISLSSTMAVIVSAPFYFGVLVQNYFSFYSPVPITFSGLPAGFTLSPASFSELPQSAPVTVTFSAPAGTPVGSRGSASPPSAAFAPCSASSLQR